MIDALRDAMLWSDRFDEHTRSEEPSTDLEQSTCIRTSVSGTKSGLAATAFGNARLIDEACNLGGEKCCGVLFE